MLWIGVFNYSLHQALKLAQAGFAFDENYGLKQGNLKHIVPFLRTPLGATKELLKGLIIYYTISCLDIG